MPNPCYMEDKWYPCKFCKNCKEPIGTMPVGRNLVCPECGYPFKNNRDYINGSRKLTSKYKKTGWFCGEYVNKWKYKMESEYENKDM